jgi:hypothetical protein
MLRKSSRTSGPEVFRAAALRLDRAMTLLRIVGFAEMQILEIEAKVSCR